MFQVSTAADPSFLAICGAIAADLWSLGGDYPWLLFSGYILGLILLSAVAIWLIDRRPGHPGRSRRYLAAVAGWLRLGAITGHIGHGWLSRHGEMAMIVVAVCVIIAGGSVVGWRATHAGDAVDRARIAAENPDEPLIDHTGRPISEAAFRGRLALVSFGYTFCPDICPTTLSTLSLTLDSLGDRAASVVTAFVTIDPARDTAAVLAAYLKNFHPGIIGMTGAEARIRTLARAYRVYYARTGEAESDDTYLMEHTAWIFLVGRDGEILQRFPHTATAAQIVARIRAEFAKPMS